MTRNEMMFEMAKAIAPIFVQEGIVLQQRIVNAGGCPEKCTIEGKTILQAQAHNIKSWASAITDEFVAETTDTTETTESEPITRFGRIWHKSNNNFTEDGEWRKVAIFTDGTLYMDNLYGKMVLIQKDGTILESFI